MERLDFSSPLLLLVLVLLLLLLLLLVLPPHVFPQTHNRLVMVIAVVVRRWTSFPLSLR